MRKIKILGIETSCDDTAISVVEVLNHKSKTPRFRILSNIVSSQVKLHAKYGGVYPMLAKREHQKNLPIVLKKALREANSSISNLQFLISKKNQKTKNQNQSIDFISVTVGPGLEPCLWQGINFAKEIAVKYKKPLIPVNHIEAHILANLVDLREAKAGDEGKLRKEANFIDRGNFNFQIPKIFPAVCLVVSGGHTQLILVKGIGKYKLIGETRDDAAGECFDKTARILRLSYPGGPIIAREAAKLKLKTCLNKYTPDELLRRLPRPMMYTKDYDFSFSGLKTAVLYDYKSRKSKIRKSKNYIRVMCQEIQQAIIDVLIHKTIKAAKDFKVKSIILGGGVVANDELKKQFTSKINCELSNVKFFVPPQNLCTDNAVMIAVTAYFNRNKKTDLRKLKADGNLRLR